MRKFLAILLALVIAIGIFASCEKPTAQLPDIPMNESTDEQKNQNPTPESNGAFFYHLQRALLLALREREMLSAAEYRHAEESLRRQRVRQAKKAMERGGGS